MTKKTSIVKCCYTCAQILNSDFWSFEPGLSFWSNFSQKLLPEGLIIREGKDAGYQGMANTTLAGLFDGHLNSPFDSFLQIWPSSFRFLDIIIGFYWSSTLFFVFYHLQLRWTPAFQKKRSLPKKLKISSWISSERKLTSKEKTFLNT